MAILPFQSFAENTSDPGEASVDFDKPLFIETIGNNTNHKVTCRVYPLLSVVELQEDQVGATYIKVKPRAKGMSDEELCESNGKNLPKLDGVFHGAIDKYIFVIGEPFGELESLTIYDGLLTTKIFNGTLNNNKPSSVINNQGKISFEYYMPLKLSCVPLKSNPQCWKTILASNHVPADIKISEPDCSAAINEIKLANSDPWKDPDRSYQITTKVRISDLAHPKIEYLNSDATCHASP